MQRGMNRIYLLHIALLVCILTAPALLGEENLAPKLRVLYWSGGTLDSLIYQPLGSAGVDAHICLNGYPGDGSILCDTINYGYSPLLALKEDWHWTRRAFIRFDTIVTSYDSLEECQLWLYKTGTATNSNWVEAYLATEAWSEGTVTWDNAPVINMGVVSSRWTPPFPDWEGWLSLDITAIYENWVIGPNHGLQLIQQDLDSDDGQEFFSSDYMFCTLSIDNLWVSQETDCDDENLVLICYEANDFVIDSIFAALRIFDDGSPVGVHTIMETVPGYPPPNLGWVNSGSNCFYWDMKADYPGNDGCDFEIVIDVMNETTEILNVTDSFPIPDAEGVAWDGENLWVTRSWYSGGLDTQRVFRVDPITHYVFSDSCITDDLFDGYTADCVWHDGYLWILGGGLSGQRAKLFKFDVSTCTIVDSSAAIIPPSRWGQGIDYFAGWFYACDSNGKIFQVSPTPPYTSTLWLDLETIHPGLMSGAISADALVFALGYIWILRNPGPAGHVLLQFDYAGNVIDSFALASTSGFGPEGITFDGECFWYTDHSKDFVYRVCLWGCEDTMSIFTCLDSKAPEVGAICPPSPIYVGDTVSLNALVAESFGSSEPGSLIIDDGVTRIAVPYSPGLGIEVPELCGLADFVIMVRDSFCNWGSDTCVLEACSRFDALLHCAPCGGITSCSTQTAEFTVIDSICLEDIESAFFTIKVFHPIGDSTVFYREGPAIDVLFSAVADSTRITLTDIPYADGDSIWLSFDSLFTAEGCKTVP